MSSMRLSCKDQTQDPSAERRMFFYLIVGGHL